MKCNKMDKIEIQLSNKEKMELAFLVFACLLYTIGGIFGMFHNERISLLLFMGAISFFGLGLVFVKKLLGPSPLIIDEDGIICNTVLFSIGQIKWKDIIKIDTMIKENKKQYLSTKHLFIHVSNPDFYIGRTDGLKRRYLEMIFKIRGTPISIRIDNLKCNCADLEALVNSHLNHK